MADEQLILACLKCGAKAGIVHWAAKQQPMTLPEYLCPSCQARHPLNDDTQARPLFDATLAFSRVVDRLNAKAPGVLERRNRAIVAFMKGDPKRTLEETGAKLGITYERVRQVLKKRGYVYKRPLLPPRPCAVQGCGGAVPRKNSRDKNCPEHKGWRDGHPLLSRIYIDKVCDVCGKCYQVTAAYERAAQRPNPLRGGKLPQHSFCSKTCAGVHLAIKAGRYRPKAIYRCLNCGSEEAKHGTAKRGGRSKPYKFCTRACFGLYKKAHSLAEIKAMAPVIAGYSDLRIKSGPEGFIRGKTKPVE